MQWKHWILRGAMIAATAGSALAERGTDGTLKVLYSQAPSLMNPYLSGGVKEVEAASLVLEPLARHDNSGTLVPWLAEVLPDQANGGVAEDRLSITWRLKNGLFWSDGSPVTSADVKFTWEYCTADGAGCAQVQKFDGITGIDTPDARTVVVRFEAPKPFPYTAFVGATTPILQRAQFSNCLGERSLSCTAANFAPIGTGPFVVSEFRPNDVVTFTANPHYRIPDRPAFSDVVLKGGGDAASTARAVLETEEFDYGWNLQLDPQVLAGMVDKGKGQLAVGFATLVERILFNLTDPSSSLGDLRATAAVPHPILSDVAVRRALSLAIDRAALVAFGYGPTGRTTCSLLPALQPETDAQTCLPQNADKARALLDGAGWIDTDGDGVREKDGTRLSLLFQTSTNAVRQDFQTLIKQWWAEIGVETQLRNVNANVFFGADPNSPDTYQKFFADVQMFAGAYDGIDPETYLSAWVCDQAPTPDNQWQGTNIARYCDPAYDALHKTLTAEGDLHKRTALSLKMDAMLTASHVVLPLVDRGRVSAHSNTLGGVRINPWDAEIWNIADWYRVK